MRRQDNDEPRLVSPGSLPEPGARGGLRDFAPLDQYTRKIVRQRRSNRLELWLLLGINVIIFALVAYVVFH